MGDGGLEMAFKDPSLTAQVYGRGELDPTPGGREC